jgi:hypothetical protein
MPQFILTNSMNAEIKAIKSKNSAITPTCNPILETVPASNNPALSHITCKKNLHVQSNHKSNQKSSQKSNKNTSMF